MNKTDIKRIRKAIKMAEEGQDYDLILWAFGEIEEVLSKEEKKANKASLMAQLNKDIKISSKMA